MEDYRKQSAQLDGTIRSYEARIESTPVGIREYDELIRDRDLAKKDYEDLDRRLNSSAMSTALQNRQQGERLEQLDPPSLPQTPARPKRALMIVRWDQSRFARRAVPRGRQGDAEPALHSVKDIRAYSQIAVLGRHPAV